MRTFIATLSALVTTAVLADNGSTVVDELDEFTDERRLSMLVFHKSVDGATDQSRFLRFLCDRGSNNIVVLFPNRSLASPSRGRLPFSPFVQVKTRFDKDPGKQLNWYLIDAEVVSDVDFEWMLASALASDRLIVKVADSETLRFDLHSARPDLLDFKRRCVSWQANTAEKPSTSGRP